jgi:hypothetical protein
MDTSNPDRTPDTDSDVPPGGDDTTADQLDADNAVEQDTIASLDPEDPPA